MLFEKAFLKQNEFSAAESSAFYNSLVLVRTQI